MSYCPNCGRKIDDENVGCTVCGYKPVIEGEIVREEVKTDGTDFNSDKNRETDPGYRESFETERRERYEPKEQGTISTPLKVIIVLLVLFLPFGVIGGLIAGIVFMGKDNIPDRSFGKILVILCSILIALWLICVCASLFLGVSTGHYYY